MKKLIKLITLIVLITMTVGMTAYAKGAPPKIKVTVNDNIVKYNGSPYIKNGEVMIPVRQTADALGGNVEWDKKAKTAWINLGMMHVELIVGKSEIYIHRDADFTGIPETIKLNNPVTFTRGKIYIPAKSVLEGMGIVVTWDKTKRVLEINDGSNLNTIKYTIISNEELAQLKDVTTWVNQNNKNTGVYSLRQDNIMYVLVAAGKKTTGGYTVGINDITLEDSKKAFVSAYVKSPSTDMMVTQVVTYPYVLVKINISSTQVTKVVGDVINVTSKEKWVTMDATTVTNMELSNIAQIKVRDLTQLEKDTVIKAFNEATIDPNSFIEMITGNLLKVTLNDGYVVTFTSYGSQTNVIANFAKDGDNRTFHLVAPEIAKLLLQN